MRRRTFISIVGGAAAWPIAVRAQQPALPVVGFLHETSPDFPDRLRGFSQGLKETGFVEGTNVAIAYRWAENQIDRLPALAAELIARRVAVICASGIGAFAAREATTTIPIVFLVSEDPAKLGLVASLARPGGTLTGINFFASELSAKRLDLLRQLVPSVARVAVLINPADRYTERILKDVETAAHSMGLQILVVRASTPGEIDGVFARLAHERPDALFVGTGPFFSGRRLQLAHWTTRIAIPTTYELRQFAEVGGLMSYGASVTEAWRQVGIYAGRILKGAKPADLPVLQSTKLELVINHQTARIIGLTVPPSLLSIADEVID